MKPSTTHGLLLLLVVAVAALAVAWTRLAAARADALADEQDLAATRTDLNDLAAWHVTAGPDAAAGEDGAADFNERVRAAAASAGLIERLVSIEPGPTVRVRDTDTLRTPVFLRLDGVSLRQVVSFLNRLTARDPATRVTGIDLSVPVAAAVKSGDGELWVADLTLSASTAAGPRAGTP